MLRLRLNNDQIIWKPGDAGRQIVNPVLTEQVGKVAKLTFTLPPTNPLWGGVTPLVDRMTLWEDYEIIFHGRVTSGKLKTSKDREIVCESDLAVLRDSRWLTDSNTGELVTSGHGRGTVDSPALENLMTWFISLHNGQVDASRRYNVGNVISTLTSATIRAPEDAPSVLDMMWAVPETYPGFLRPRWEAGSGGAVVSYLDYTEEAQLGTADQAIKLGSNIIDLEDFLDHGDVFTVLHGYDSEGGTWYGYQDNALVSSFGEIHKPLILSDLSSRWSDTASGLRSETKKYYEENAYAIRSLKINAIDLTMAGYDVDKIRLGNIHPVISAAHGLSTSLQCQKITRRLDNPGSSVYEFGAVRSTLTEKLK